MALTSFVSSFDSTGAAYSSSDATNLLCDAIRASQPNLLATEVMQTPRAIQKEAQRTHAFTTA